MPMREELQRTNELPEIVEKIVQSYGDGDPACHFDAAPLPGRDEVEGVLARLKEILFPGYFGDLRVSRSSIIYRVGERIGPLYWELCEVIWKALRHECKRLGSVCTLCEDQAEETAIAFLRRIPAIRELLAQDIRAELDGDPAAKSYDEIVFSYPAVEAISTYRLAHELLLLGIPLVPRIMTEIAHARTGIDIHPGAKIGRRFFIDHGTGIVIGETTEIGDDVKLYQGVTLGALSVPRDERGTVIRNRKRHPTIEDAVTIYANATILGGETVIGREAVIGGNVFLTRSVPPRTKVVLEGPMLRYKSPSGSTVVEPYGQDYAI